MPLGPAKNKTQQKNIKFKYTHSILTQPEWQKQTANAGEVVGKGDPFYYAGGNVN